MSWTLVLALTAAVLTAAEPLPFSAIVDGEIIHAERVVAYGLTFTDIDGLPKVVDRVITIAPIHARFAGGSVEATIVIDLAQRFFALQATATGSDLATLITQQGGVPGGVGGTLVITFSIHAPFDRANPPVANGTIAIHNGDLLQLGPLSNLLIGDARAAPGQDTAEASFDLIDNRFELRRARIVSPGASVRLRGTVGTDGRLDLLAVPYPEFALLQIVPGIGDAAAWLLGNASSRLARARIRGTLSHPAISITPFADR